MAAISSAWAWDIDGMVSRVVKFGAHGFKPSPLHAPDRNWSEGNCYTDLWIAVLHSLGLEPRACLGPTLACGFNADQWTFFKPSAVYLYRLYGVVIEEMTVYRSLLSHCQAHIAAGQLPLVEVDSFFLPDTQQTDYRKHHSKTTIALNALDANKRKLEYFHNAGYFVLQGDDFDGVIRLREKAASEFLPPYCETVKFEHVTQRENDELKTLARNMAVTFVQSRPEENPIQLFAGSINDTLTQLAGLDESAFHAWVFASLRQLGAGFELAAIHLRWLASAEEKELFDAARHFDLVAGTAKMLVMKTARMAMSGKVKSLSEPLSEMEAQLNTAYALIEDHL
ncbi:MAG: DUF1839 family protein [bacterium]